MLKKFLATVSVLTIAAVALAQPPYDVELVPVPYVAPATDLAYGIGQYESEGWATFDLVVTVDDPTDAWTVAYADAVTLGTFFQHPMGGNAQPDPAQFGFFGLVQYDSFWTTPEEWPNPNVDPALNATVFAPGSPLTLLPNELEAEWYVDPEDPQVGEGVWTIMRLTTQWSDNPDYLCVTGDMYYQNTGGTPFPYSVCIPEPASLALLALGSLALIRRR